MIYVTAPLPYWSPFYSYSRHVPGSNVDSVLALAYNMSDLANTLFPPPPDYYKLYTGNRDAAGLDKPRADWVEEDGRWLCFGQEQNVCCCSACTER